jgi:heme exporter protein D
MRTLAVIEDENAREAQQRAAEAEEVAGGS